MVYDAFPKVLSKRENKIVVEFDGKKIPIYKNDKIYVLTDIFVGDPNSYRKPKVVPMTFDELYEAIFSDDDFDEYYYFSAFSHICGISVIH